MYERLISVIIIFYLASFLCEYTTYIKLFLLFSQRYVLFVFFYHADDWFLLYLSESIDIAYLQWAY